MMPQIDYNDIAGTYAQTRTAAPWIIETLVRHLLPLPAGSVVLEVGCGTGNHSRALATRLPQHQYEGFDQSTGMLREAQLLPSKVIFRQGDAQLFWPYSDGYADIAFMVDVIHYIKDLPAFFGEARRVLKPDGTILIATDSEADLQDRSLTRFFPEILEHELARYPTANALQQAALVAGFSGGGAERVEGTQSITDEYIAKLSAKCSSALRLIPPAAHTAGIDRVRQAQAAGEPWRSLYTIYCFTKSAY